MGQIFSSSKKHSSSVENIDNYMVYNLSGLQKYFLSNSSIPTVIFSIKPITNYVINSKYKVTNTHSWNYSNLYLADHLCLDIGKNNKAKIGLTQEQSIALGLISLDKGEIIIIDYNNEGLE